jgi:hypothetical protein
MDIVAITILLAIILCLPFEMPPPNKPLEVT